MTVGDLLDRCSSMEITEWMAHFKLRSSEREARRG
jgi:hypothetical protein